MSEQGILLQVGSRSVLGEEDKERFDNVFSHLVKDVVSCTDTRLRPVMEHSKWALEYNVPNGKKTRGLLTVASYKLLTNNLTDDDLFKSSIMGWCVEMLQAFFLVSDDIADNSYTRRGQLCWYRQPDVGLSYAVCDITMIEVAIYKILKKYFRSEPYYVDVVELFHEITHNTVNGQLMDIHFAKESLDNFTQDNYDAIVLNKTCLYSFFLPVALAMHMAGIHDKHIFEETKKILVQIGHLFQVQDDYLDCFGDPKATGKIGTDIQENKCSWLIVNALKLASKEDVDQLKLWYGKDDPKLVKLVYDKYVELQLVDFFNDYEKETYESILATISELPPTVPANILRFCLQTLFKRKK
ncbi:hypothetical protein CHUAL_008744 [Chamberlinius hualienensis]